MSLHLEIIEADSRSRRLRYFDGGTKAPRRMDKWVNLAQGDCYFLGDSSKLRIKTMVLKRSSCESGHDHTGCHENVKVKNKYLFSERMYHWPVRFLLVASGDGFLKNINHVCACLLISIDKPFTLEIEGRRITSHSALIPQGITPSVSLAKGRHCLWGLDGLHIHKDLLKESYAHQITEGISHDFEPTNVFTGHAQRCADARDMETIDTLYRQLVNPHSRTELMVNWDARIVSYLYHAVTSDIETKETLAYAASRACMSESNFRQLFKRSFGVSFSRYCIYRKLKLFCKIYAETRNLSQSATGSGFVDLPHAINSYKNALGTSPGSIFLSDSFQMVFSTVMDCMIVPLGGISAR